MSAKRTYRRTYPGSRLTSFPVAVKETDLWIAVSSPSFTEDLPRRIERLVLNRRSLIESYLDVYPHLKFAVEPCILGDDAPEILVRMTRAGNKAGVGPMAAVAGALAEEVGCYLLDQSEEVIVENGGDIFINTAEAVRVGIYAGQSPLSGKLALKVEPDRKPVAVCTSSGTLGPSLSFGRADAAVTVSSSTPLADAAATALGNLVKGPADLENALAYARGLKGIDGAVVICGEKIAAWGKIELTAV